MEVSITPTWRALILGICESQSDGCLHCSYIPPDAERKYNIRLLYHDWYRNFESSSINIQPEECTSHFTGCNWHPAAWITSQTTLRGSLWYSFFMLSTACLSRGCFVKVRLKYPKKNLYCFWDLRVQLWSAGIGFGYLASINCLAALCTQDGGGGGSRHRGEWHDQ